MGMVEKSWIPACAGMTGSGGVADSVRMVEKSWIPACAGMTGLLE